MPEIDAPPKNEIFDAMHSDFMDLLDRIEMQDNADLAAERFSILEAHGYKLRVFTGPKGLVDRVEDESA